MNLKLLKQTALAFFAIATLSSCEKETTQPASPPHFTAKWLGEYEGVGAYWTGNSVDPASFDTIFEQASIKVSAYNQDTVTMEMKMGQHKETANAVIDQDGKSYFFGSGFFVYTEFHSDSLWYKLTYPISTGPSIAGITIDCPKKQ